jgi:CheY-like chemotaxis protein
MAVVLVVEDEAQVLVLAESYLEEHGHRTFSAANVDQALAIIDGPEQIDVLFTDIGLNDNLQAGLELAKEAVERRPAFACNDDLWRVNAEALQCSIPAETPIPAQISRCRRQALGWPAEGLGSPQESFHGQAQPKPLNNLSRASEALSSPGEAGDRPYKRLFARGGP